MNQIAGLSMVIRLAVLTVSVLSTSVSFGQQGSVVPVNAVELEIIEEIPLSTDIAGLLEFVDPAQEGATVKKGQELIRLVDDVAVAELESARKKAEATTEIDFARIALEKAKIDEQVQLDTNAKNPDFPPYSESELRQSRLEVQKQEATLQKAEDEIAILKLDVKVKEAQLKQYSVSSPVDGMVTQVLRFPGQSVRQGDAILTVTDLTRLRAKLKVKIEYRDLLSTGQEVQITVGRSASAARTSPSRSQSAPTGSGLLSNSPSLRGSGSTSRSEPEPEPIETPEQPEPVAGTTKQFTGTIYYISPKLEGSGSGQLVTVYAAVPNRFENGKYVLSAGTKVTAQVRTTAP
jgi:multidrug efflux pump subunit AcrA (membrane-fusion protein)